jgi:hypothetical protein
VYKALYAAYAKVSQERDWVLDRQQVTERIHQLSPEQRAKLLKSVNENDPTNPINVAKRFYEDTLLPQETELRKETEGLNLPWENVDNLKKKIHFPTAKELLEKI